LDPSIAVIRSNDAGCINGITFIDRNPKTVMTGAWLSKALSANICQDSHSNMPDILDNDNDEQLKKGEEIP